MVHTERRVSFTRDKNFYKQQSYFVSKEMCFVVDGNKLSNNYKIKPFAYSFADYEESEYKDEKEEVVDRTINNFNKYVVKTILFENMFSEYRESNYVKYQLMSRILFDRLDQKFIFEDIVKEFEKYYIVEIK